MSNVSTSFRKIFSSSSGSFIFDLGFHAIVTFNQWRYLASAPFSFICLLSFQIIHDVFQNASDPMSLSFSCRLTICNNAPFLYSTFILLCYPFTWPALLLQSTKTDLCNTCCIFPQWSQIYFNIDIKLLKKLHWIKYIHLDPEKIQ